MIWLCAAGSVVIAQVLFIFGAGTVRLGQPIRKRRLWIPVLTATCMACLLSVGSLFTTLELAGLVLRSSGAFIGFIVICCMFCGVAIWGYGLSAPRMMFLTNVTKWLLISSVAVLIACTAAHIIVVDRSQAPFAGVATTFGVLIALYVMLFAIGPLAVVLLLRPRYRLELHEGPRCTNCDYDLRGTTAAGRTTCPECGRGIARGGR